MLIRSSKDQNDNRYYVPIIVYSASLDKRASLDFLIDTGAPRTVMSWNDAEHYGVHIQSLPKDDYKKFEGIGGIEIWGYLLPQSALIFRSDSGNLKLSVSDLSVADNLTTTGEYYPPSSSVLGLDILEKFDLLFDDSSNPTSLTLKF